jgi:hypothetical protein
MVQGMEQEIPYAEPVVWMVLDGCGVLLTGSAETDTPFRRGDTILLPAELRDVRVRTDENCAWLEITLPAPSDLAEFDRPTAEELRSPDSHIQVGIERKPSA